MIGRIKQFFKEVITELKKVTWPSRSEVFGSTLVVIVVTLLIAVIVGIFDFIVSHAIDWVLLRTA
jgi:preprotein translocase subunit SecE